MDDEKLIYAPFLLAALIERDGGTDGTCTHLMEEEDHVGCWGFHIGLAKDAVKGWQVLV